MPDKNLGINNEMSKILLHLNLKILSKTASVDNQNNTSEKILLLTQYSPSPSSQTACTKELKTG